MPKVYAIDGIIPVVHETAFVHPTAVLIGDVIVGPGCYIAPGASLRGDFGCIVVGEGSNVQDNCSVHSFSGCVAHIGRHANIGHGAVLHGCEIGDAALVGMNAVVLDGARIGAGALVSALSLVPSEFEAPPGTLIVGAPAKVVRELSELEREWMRAGNRDYLELTERSRESLERVAALTETELEGPRLRHDGSKPLFETRRMAKEGS